LIKLTDFKQLFTPNDTRFGNGLYADLPDLMAMRRYVPIMRLNRSRQSYAPDSGGIRSAFKGRGIEMEEIREYQFGDDVRDIDWRVTARMNEPFTKIYTQERNREVYVWLDISPVMQFGSHQELKSVTAAKITAFLAWMALANHDRFGCIIFDGQKSYLLKSGNDRAYIAAICKKISDLSQKALNNTINDAEAFAKSIKLLQRQAKRNGSVFIVSSMLFWGDSQNSELAHLAHKGDLYLINIYDKLEREAPPAGQYKAQFGSDNLVFDSYDKNFVKAYREYFVTKNNEIENYCRQIGGKYIDFSQNSSFIGNLKIF